MSFDPEWTSWEMQHAREFWICRADADSECNTLTGWLMGFHGTWSSARSSLLSDI